MSSGFKCDVFVKVIIRGFHLLSTMLMFTLLILECFFDLNKNSKLQEDPEFKKVVSHCGIAMIASGIMLTIHMRRSDALPTQNNWMAYFPPKFFMSLLLTPISDKLAMLVVGHRKEVVDQESDVMRYQFDMASEWQSTIRMFRLGLMCMLFAYSAYVRQFREKENNFVDQQGLEKMLDRFIRRSPQLRS